ncbi:LysM peptidoglycan-binding domain-containing protein [Paenibacillus sp. CN-4]|uniref:LysM peptidoglycan-binding domain-containing protein n=1 Tax=Paenibacillus nanchangensis TaxID=3348343 RepID=UPI003978AF49
MKIHMVKEGESLYTISQKYGVPLEKIVEANPQIADPNKLNIGDKVKIPSSPVPVPEQGDVYYKHTVKQGDSLWKLSKAWGIPLKDVIEANPQLKNPNALLVGEVVNLPKKTVPGSGTAGHAAPGNEPAPLAPAASGKTVPGSKTYTGPKEKETAPMPPAPPVQPAPVPPAPVEPPQIIVQEPMPQPQPVQHSVHTEVQSLYVQVSVPQEAPTYYQHVLVPPAPEVYLPPSPCVENKPVCKPECEPVCEPVCHPSMGYPGLTENPYHNDCPTPYPFYDTLPAQAVEPAAACPPEMPWAAPVELPYSCPPYGGYSPVMPAAMEECHSPQTPGYGMTAGAYQGFCPPYGYGAPGFHPAVPFPQQAYAQSGLPQAYQPGYGYPGQVPGFGAQDQMMHGMMDYEYPHAMSQGQSAGMHIPGSVGPKSVALPWPACNCQDSYAHDTSQFPMQGQGMQMHGMQTQGMQFQGMQTQGMQFQGMQTQGMQGDMTPWSPLPELPSLPQDLMAGQFDYHNREEEQAEAKINETAQQQEEVRIEQKEETSSTSSTSKKAKTAAPEKKAKVSAVESNRGSEKKQTKGQKVRNTGGRTDQKKRRNPWISD